MKNLILAVSLFVLAIAFIIFNTIFLNTKTNELITLADALPSPANMAEAEEALVLLEETWKSCYDIIAISVDFDYFYMISQQLAELRAFYERNDDSQYASALYALRVSFDHLRDIELPSLKNIF